MTIQQHAERISEWDGHSYANESKYDCCMEMGYAILKEIEKLLPQTGWLSVGDGIKIREKIKELRDEV